MAIPAPPREKGGLDMGGAAKITRAGIRAAIIAATERSITRNIDSDLHRLIDEVVAETTDAVWMELETAGLVEPDVVASVKTVKSTKSVTTNPDG